MEKTGEKAGDSPTTVVENPLATPIEQGCQSVLSFFDLASIAEHQKASPYTVETELDILTEIATDSEATPGARVAAVKARRRILEQALQLAGILTKTRAELSGAGDEAAYKLVREAQQITAEGSRNAMAALSAHVPTRDFTQESDQCLKTVDVQVLPSPRPPAEPDAVDQQGSSHL